MKSTAVPLHGTWMPYKHSTFTSVKNRQSKVDYFIKKNLKHLRVISASRLIQARLGNDHKPVFFNSDNLMDTAVHEYK